MKKFERLFPVKQIKAGFPVITNSGIIVGAYISHSLDMNSVFLLNDTICEKLYPQVSCLAISPMWKMKHDTKYAQRSVLIKFVLP